MRERLEEEKTCVECQAYVPPYRKYLCESCFEDMLKYKLEEVKEE